MAKATRLVKGRSPGSRKVHSAGILRFTEGQMCLVPATTGLGASRNPGIPRTPARGHQPLFSVSSQTSEETLETSCSSRCNAHAKAGKLDSGKEEVGRLLALSLTRAGNSARLPGNPASQLQSPNGGGAPRCGSSPAATGGEPSLSAGNLSVPLLGCPPFRCPFVPEPRPGGASCTLGLESAPRRSPGAAGRRPRPTGCPLGGADWPSQAPPRAAGLLCPAESCVCPEEVGRLGTPR